MDNSVIYTEIKDFFSKVKKHKSSYIFFQPIEEIINDCPRYTEICEKPIDLNIIDRKTYENNYRNIEDLKEDLDLMVNNCKKFNSNSSNWIHKAAVALEDFTNNNFKKSQIKIQKYKEKVAQSYAQKANKLRDESIYSGHIDNKQNFQVVNCGDDDKITRKIKSLFSKISPALNIKEEEIDDIIGIILDKIIKRNKAFDQMYEDTMKFMGKNISNEQTKSYFSKKFRKLLRTIKEDQNDIDNKAFNIKIDLDENEEKREEKDKIDLIRKEISYFIDNQKMPEVFRQNTEYPLEPGLKRKINNYVNDIKKKFTSYH